jgi:hypothetical protein
MCNGVSGQKNGGYDPAIYVRHTCLTDLHGGSAAAAA